MTARPCPVIIDTDIGDDIDDALALALAVHSPEIALVGVTTVYQCAALRARLVRHLLSAYGRADVPVVAGVDRPLLGARRLDWWPHQAAVLGLHPPAGTADDASEPQAPLRAAAGLARSRPQGSGMEACGRGDGEGALGEGPAAGEGAVGFIIREGMRREGLVLLTIGAMTNAALALACEPRLASRLRVVAMAGAFDRQGVEYNVACDPEAVACVLAAGARVAFVGLDVTMQTAMRATDVARLLQAPGEPEAALAGFLRAWQGFVGPGAPHTPVLHDPLAVAAVFRPEWLRWREARVAVELAAPNLRGQTYQVPGSSNALVAHAVDAGFSAWCGDRLLSDHGAGTSTR